MASIEIDGVNGVIKSTVSDSDLTIKGNDGGSEVSALAFDMSDAGTATFNHDVKLGDDSELVFGAGGDLKIRHDSSNNVSFISESGSSALHIRGGNIVLKSQTDNDDYIKCIEDGGVELYHDNTKKFETTSGGISVTGAIEASGASTITTADNTDTLTLKSTDADANAGPILNLIRDSGSPADADFIGGIKYTADNDANEATEFAKIDCQIDDASNGTEDGQLFIRGMSAGTLRNRIAIYGASTVINDDSIDADFRVESNNNINLIKVDAGDDRTHFGGTSYQGMSLGVHNFHSGTTSDQAGLIIGSNSASYANNILKIATLRDQNTSYNFIAAFSGNGSDNLDDDLEFRAKGDGNVLCDESFTGSGADYSEYFEWSDGNSSDEDRVGLSVKLDGNKIVVSSDSDNASDIIGVVSGSPVIVGDADGTGTRWTEKYLKDDYGRRIMEEFTVTSWRDEANKTDHSYATDRIPSNITAPDDATVTTTEEDGSTKLLRRKLNPDYNSSLTYVARADRKEWDTVGLVGKLRMKKGQKTGTNWIKMRDISETVEEWLVR